MRVIVGMILIALSLAGCSRQNDKREAMDFIESELLGEVTHWLSKSGELYREDELKALSPRISSEQAVELYCYLRDNGERWESEWRGQFISIFPHSNDALPDIAEEDRWQTEIFEIIHTGDLNRIKDFIAEIGILENTKFDPAETYQEGRDLGFTEKVEYIPFDFFPIQVENDNGEYPIAFARHRGKDEIAEYLESVIEELSQQYRDAFEAGRVTKD